MRNTVHGYGATLAFVIEVSVTASLLGILSGIEEKVRLVLALLFMNAVTFGVFILWLHPFIGSVVITEALVWLTETMVVTMITRRLGDRPLSFVWCLPITALGNLCSFFAGLA